MGERVLEQRLLGRGFLEQRLLGRDFLEQRLLGSGKLGGCELGCGLLERGQLGCSFLGRIAPRRAARALIPQKSECPLSPAKGGGSREPFAIACDLR